MRLGHLMLCDQREGQSPQKRYEEMMEEVRLMDELGYWSVWFAEHHFDGYSLIPDSLLWCAAAARETKQIRLGAGVVVLPFHHPVRAAEQAAMSSPASARRWKKANTGTIKALRFWSVASSRTTFLMT